MVKEVIQVNSIKEEKKKFKTRKIKRNQGKSKALEQFVLKD